MICLYFYNLHLSQIEAVVSRTSENPEIVFPIVIGTIPAVQRNARGPSISPSTHRGVFRSSSPHHSPLNERGAQRSYPSGGPHMMESPSAQNILPLPQTDATLPPREYSLEEEMQLKVDPARYQRANQGESNGVGAGVGREAGADPGFLNRWGAKDDARTSRLRSAKSLMTRVFLGPW